MNDAGSTIIIIDKTAMRLFVLVVLVWSVFNNWNMRGVKMQNRCKTEAFPFLNRW
jgi:hypothetical protein